MSYLEEPSGDSSAASGGDTVSSAPPPAAAPEPPPTTGLRDLATDAGINDIGSNTINSGTTNTGDGQPIAKTISKMIISFWVRVGGDDAKPPEDKWNAEWLPEHLDEHIQGNRVAFPGASYWSTSGALGQQYPPQHLWAWPPGDEATASDPTRAATWKDGMLPFISWGDPSKLKYKRVEWKMKTLRNDYWIYGRGGAPQEFVCQYPELADGSGGATGTGTPTVDPTPATPEGVGGVPSAPGQSAAGSGGEDGIVPPSCIGSHNGRLRIILQLSSRAKYTGYAWAMGKADAVHIKTPMLPKGGPPAAGYKDFSTEFGAVSQFVGNAIFYDDVSDLEFGQHPEVFIMDPDVQVGDGNWHHVLLAFDLGAAAGGAASPASKDATPEGGTPSSGAASGLITVEATGDQAEPPLPGTWGQYSGINGEYALAPYSPPYTQRERGEPWEDVGLGLWQLKGGKITSGCKAWLAVDGNQLTGKDLHFSEVWDQAIAHGATLTELESDGSIVPVNALVALTDDPRQYLTTNQTGWEREYRTLLGGFNGPAAIIDVTDEKRRYSYDVPKYELSEATMPRGKFTIPAGKLWGDIKWNQGCKLAELYIWTDQAQDVGELISLFIDDKGDPVPPGKAEEKLGKANIKLHFASNWKGGINTGKDGFRKTGTGSDQTKVDKPDRLMVVTGRIDRFTPDPELSK